MDPRALLRHPAADSRSLGRSLLGGRSDQRLVAVHAGLQSRRRPEAQSLLRAGRFDQAVSVQPTPAAALSYLRSRGEPTPPHTTVFTDFVAHTQWIHPYLDRYCVPAEEIAHELTAKGLPRQGVAVTGIPVACEFLQQPDRAAARLAMGLSPRLPVLLFMDGSGGGFGRLETARAVLGMEQAFQTVRGRSRARSRRAPEKACGRARESDQGVRLRGSCPRADGGRRLPRHQGGRAHARRGDGRRAADHLLRLAPRAGSAKRALHGHDRRRTRGGIG